MDSQNKRKHDEASPAEMTNLLLQRSGLIPASVNNNNQVAGSTNPLASLLQPPSTFGTTSSAPSSTSAIPNLSSFSNPLAMLQQTQALTAAIAQQSYAAPASNNAGNTVNPLYGATGNYSYNTASFATPQQPFYGGGGGVSSQGYSQQASAAPYQNYVQPQTAFGGGAQQFGQYGQPPSTSYNANVNTYGNVSSNTGHQSNHTESRDRRSDGDYGNRHNSNRSALNPSLLHESERKTICRNWNNNRCDLDNCRFRHVCLRCGSEGHRERQCSVSQETRTPNLPLSSAERRTVCRDWNNQRCPRPNQCKFRHVCLGCGSADHIEKDCRVSPGGSPISGSASGYGGGREREYNRASGGESNRRDSDSSYSRRNDDTSNASGTLADLCLTKI